MEGEGQPKKKRRKQASQEAPAPLPEVSPFPQLLRRVKAQLSRMRCALLLGVMLTEVWWKTGSPCTWRATRPTQRA